MKSSSRTFRQLENKDPWTRSHRSVPPRGTCTCETPLSKRQRVVKTPDIKPRLKPWTSQTLGRRGREGRSIRHTPVTGSWRSRARQHEQARVFWSTFSWQALEGAAVECVGRSRLNVQPPERVHVTSTSPHHSTTAAPQQGLALGSHCILVMRTHWSVPVDTHRHETQQDAPTTWPTIKHCNGAWLQAQVARSGCWGECCLGLPAIIQSTPSWTASYGAFGHCNGVIAIRNDTPLYEHTA